MSESAYAASRHAIARRALSRTIAEARQPRPSVFARIATALGL